MIWEGESQEKFEAVLGKIPVFLRDIAQKKVRARAEQFAAREGRSLVTLQDVVGAFFKETPFGFHGPMKADMDALGIDYNKYV